MILDVDGVLTNGTKVYDIDGNVVHKVFNDRDFTAIKRFKEEGVNVCFLSGDKKFNEEIAKKRKIDFFYGRNENGEMDKISKLKKILIQYKSKKFAYVGDDYYDLEMIKSADTGFCPNDAVDDIKKASDYVLNLKGSEGVVAEIFTIYIDNK